MGQTFSQEDALVLYVNGRRYAVPAARLDVSQSLSAFLRQHGLTATKVGCGVAACGACTVMVSSPGSAHRAVNACRLPLILVDGCHVTTAEGSDDILAEIQRRLANGFGSQCGFCTPGMTMSLYAALRNHPDATAAQLQMCLDGNLCRCTGYRPILDVARSLGCGGCAGSEGSCCMGLDQAARQPIPAGQRGEFIMPPALLAKPVASGYIECANGEPPRVRASFPSPLLQALPMFAL